MYRNQTDLAFEIICISKDDWGYNDDSCLEKSIYPSASYIEQLQSSGTGEHQYSVLDFRVGCYACDPAQYVPVVALDQKETIREYEDVDGHV